MSRKNSESLKQIGLSPEKLSVGPRRGVFVRIPKTPPATLSPFDTQQLEYLNLYNITYRALCAILFNSVPKSGHPGGSVSSGHIVQSLLFHILKYDFGNPLEETNDLLFYAAGHKAMGLYAMWALRNEICRIGAPDLLPKKVSHQLRLEDLLGFRRNPTQETPLFQELNAKALDGHPTPGTPHVKFSSGPSGTGVPTSFGYALGALDMYRDNPPQIHVLEGEGGATAGRVHEAIAAAASGCMHNVTIHLDWNQAAIDSDAVCRDGENSGDYVQWEPHELFHLHDWNVFYVEDGFDFPQVLAAQIAAQRFGNSQPTAIVYRTVKGWKYGIEGMKSHGAGHDFYSPEFYQSLAEFENGFKAPFPRWDGDKDPIKTERFFYDSLMHIRATFEKNQEFTSFLATALNNQKEGWKGLNRAPRADHPNLSAVYESKAITIEKTPEELTLSPGSQTTLRGQLGDCLRFLNRETNGAFIGAAADLYASTSLSNLGKDFPKGFFNSVTNPDSRMISVGGICEDAIGGYMVGASTFGSHIGVSSSYGAFIAPLEHIYCRCHSISQQTKQEVATQPVNTWIMIVGHAGIKTGEDGPTHADPQPLQLLQENFPRGSMITLTPWEATEVWPLLMASLRARPAVLAPFVTRPAETVPDRSTLGLAPANNAVNGMYRIRKADEKAKTYHGTIVVQGSGVANTFFTDVLPRLDREGHNFNVYYVASLELFDLLPADRKREIFPEEHAREAVGITGFTIPTMYRWVTSQVGRELTMYPHKQGRFLGSGKAHKVLEEAGMNADGQYNMCVKYAQRPR